MEEEINKLAEESGYDWREVAKKGFYFLYKEIPDSEASLKYRYPVTYQRGLGYIGRGEVDGKLKYWATKTKFESREPKFERLLDAFNHLKSQEN